MTPMDRAISTGLEHRRSRRVHGDMPVVVQGKAGNETAFADLTRTVVFSAHGCLITLSRPVRIAEKLVLRNPATGQEQDCRVVFVGDAQGGRTELGLRFKAPAPQFWGIEDAPADWKKAAT